jgi:hypothetical protein
MTREAVMTGLSPQPAARRRAPWAGLLEDRFTNVDLVMLAAALALTGIIGVLSGAAFAR